MYAIRSYYAEDAVHAAETLGYPVVLKAEAPTLVHKTEAGGVVLDLGDEAALRAAHAAMAGRLGDTPGLSFLVQQQRNNFV